MQTAMGPDWRDEDFGLWEADLEVNEAAVERIVDKATCAALGQFAVWEGSAAFLADSPPVH